MYKVSCLDNINITVYVPVLHIELVGIVDSNSNSHSNSNRRVSCLTNLTRTPSVFELSWRKVGHQFAAGFPLGPSTLQQTGPIIQLQVSTQ